MRYFQCRDEANGYLKDNPDMNCYIGRMIFGDENGNPFELILGWFVGKVPPPALPEVRFVKDDKVGAEERKALKAIIEAQKLIAKHLTHEEGN